MTWQLIIMDLDIGLYSCHIPTVKFAKLISKCMINVAKYYSNIVRNVEYLFAFYRNYKVIYIHHLICPSFYLFHI